MKALMRLRSFFRGLVHRGERDLELDAEVRAHLDLLTDEKVRAGMPLAEARRAARIELGGVEQVKEEVRSARSGALLEQFWQDVRYGARQLRRNPGFTAVAVITLALGIGANSAIFSVVDAALLSVIRYPHPERIMAIGIYAENAGDISCDWPDAMDWKKQNHVFQYVAPYHFDPLNLTGSGDPVQLEALEASTDFYRITQTVPALGRLYTDAEDTPGTGAVVLLSHNLWRNRFGADPGILGTSINLSGKLYTVIGVMPADLWVRRPVDIFVPIAPFADNPDWQDRGEHPALRVMGRLKPGVTLAQARADMTVIGKREEQQYPLTNSGHSVTVRLLRDGVTSDTQPTLFVLLAAVSFVLLTACANVANLHLARSSVRQKEMAVRSALGATRTRLILQMLVESTMLSFAGGGLGLLLAAMSIQPLLRLAPKDVNGLENAQLNLSVLLFTTAVAIASGLIFGVVPAFQTSRPKLGETLKQGMRSVAGGRTRSQVRNAVLIAEMAFALVLTVGAGLMVRSFFRVQAAPLGMNAEKVLTFNIRLPERTYTNDPAVLHFYEEAVRRLETVPGVRSAAVVRCLPMAGGCWDSGYVLGDRPVPPQANLPDFDTNAVSPGYFQTLGIPLIAGRLFDARDTATAPHVAIINQTLARRMWPDGTSPVGKTIKQGWPQLPTPYMEIVGVVGDVKRDGPDGEQAPEVFMPQAQKTGRGLTFVVRTEQAPMSVAGVVAAEIHALDKDLPLVDVQPMTQYLGDALERRQFSTLLLGLFGALALVLAAVGIYGVMAYTVSQRLPEMGIRLALGARRGDVFRLVIGNAVLLAALGVAIGLGASLGLTRFMRSLLFEVSASDPLTFACVGVLLASVAAFAAYLPARRAASVDPLIALRYE